jgi:hypothetical protein
MAATDRVLMLEDGPWSQMIDSRSPTARVEGAYTLGQNVYPMDSGLGETLVGRPGSRPAGARLVTFPAFIQAITQFSHGASETTVAVAGGELYTFNWTTETWTKVVTTANLTTKSITLSAVPLVVACVTFGDALVVSDQNNIPFLWDGTSGSAGLTKLTNCPPLYGQPTVHQARLFGIKALDQRTMVWSEADDATTGYDTGGFTNAWTLRQTDQHPLTRLVGTNSGLIIFRARSVTMASGDVGTLEFQSTDTREAIDSSVGTYTPFAVLEIGPNILFLSSDLQPYLLRPGATGVVPIWSGLRNTLVGGAARANPQQAFAVNYTPASLAIFAVSDSLASTAPNTLLVYDVRGDNPVPVGVWNGWDQASISAMAMVLDTQLPTPVPRWMHGDYGTSGGYVYLHGNPDDATFLTDDSLPAGAQPIYHLVHCQPLGYSTGREKIFDREDVSFRAPTPQQVSIWNRTPRGDSDPYALTVDPADVEIETKVTLGLDEEGRWIAPRVAHQALGEQFGLVAVSVTGYAADNDPADP